MTPPALACQCGGPEPHESAECAAIDGLLVHLESGNFASEVTRGLERYILENFGHLERRRRMR